MQSQTNPNTYHQRGGGADVLNEDKIIKNYELEEDQDILIGQSVLDQRAIDNQRERDLFDNKFENQFQTNPLL